MTTEKQNGATELIVIGSTAFTPGFALAGVRTTIISTPERVLADIESHRDAGIIILDGELTATLSATQREEIETSLAPVIITIEKTSDAQEQRLRRAIMNTLGVDLLK